MMVFTFPKSFTLYLFVNSQPSNTLGWWGRDAQRKQKKSRDGSREDNIDI